MSDVDLFKAAMAALDALVRASGWTPKAEASALVVSRYQTGGTVDTLLMRNKVDAVAERTGPAGDRVWRFEGTVVEVVRQLDELPGGSVGGQPNCVQSGCYHAHSATSPRSRPLWTRPTIAVTTKEHAMTNPSAEDASVHALAELKRSGRWQMMPPGKDGVLVYTRLWEREGSADLLTVKGQTDTVAERLNAYGQLVYRNVGTVLGMIEAITELPDPGTPGAPVHVIGLLKPDSHDPIYDHVEVPDDETS